LPIKLTQAQSIQLVGRTLYKNDWIVSLTRLEYDLMDMYPIGGPEPKDPETGAEVERARHRGGLSALQREAVHECLTNLGFGCEPGTRNDKEELERVLGEGFPRQPGKLVSPPSVPRAAGLARYGNPPGLAATATESPPAPAPSAVRDPGPAVSRSSSREKPFWGGAQSEATVWLEDNGFPESGDGNQAKLECHILKWLGDRGHEASLSAVRRHVVGWIEDYRLSLGA
jgi:hypothetical protein